MLALRKILVPTDFDPPSTAALDYALDLASRLHASVTLLHAYEMLVAAIADGPFAVTSEMLAQRAVQQDALDAIVAGHNSLGVPLDALLRQGRTAETIHSTASEVGADLIVIGTHGRRGLAHALFGGVAERVIRTAAVPVLAVHPVNAPNAEVRAQ